MKFIAEHPKTAEILDGRASSGVCLIVSHYFWVAGTAMQRSQEGLLRSLLHQILSFQPALILIACPRRWRMKTCAASWSAQELWTALRISIDHFPDDICFLIDGMDECQQSDVEQGKLVAALQALTTKPGLKMVVSSRSWTVFMHALGVLDNRLTMDSVNEPDIAKYVIGRFADCEPSLVDIDYRDICKRDRGKAMKNEYHYDLHDLIQATVEKADGVFLWVALVMDRLVERLSAGQDVADLRTRLEDFPEELDDFFRALVFDRIHDTWRRPKYSETAMAAKIILSHGVEDSFFLLWMLARSHGETGSSLLNANFHRDMEFVRLDRVDAADMLQETRLFLHACLKDLVTVNDIELDSWGYWIALRYFIQFTHRSVLDFMQTPAMQELLASHTPLHFQSESFKRHMLIARTKFTIVREQYTSDDDGAVELLLDAFSHLLQDLQMWPQRTDGIPLLEAQQLESIALFQLETFILISSRREQDSYLCHLIGCLCAKLAAYNLFRFTTELLRRRPEILCGSLSGNGFHALGLLYASLLSSGHRLTMLRMLLEAGADGNDCDLPVWADKGGYYRLGDSPWVIFLAFWAETSRGDRPVVEVDEGVFPGMAEVFISHGANVEALVPHRVPVAWRPNEWCQISSAKDEQGTRLTAREVLLTKLGSSDLDHWSQLIAEHSRSEKQAEIKVRRRESIARWPQEALCNGDRKLLGLPPQPKHHMPDFRDEPDEWFWQLAGLYNDIPEKKERLVSARQTRLQDKDDWMYEENPSHPQDRELLGLPPLSENFVGSEPALEDTDLSWEDTDSSHEDIDSTE
jgi:hypothetical protein